MNTEKIAAKLKLTGQLQELHGQNPFKVKALINAAYRLDKTDINLEGKNIEELAALEGIGKGIASKIYELQTTGKLEELEEALSITPIGVIEMLRIKGIGPKKVGQLWKELEVESPGELLYACNENRLVTLKGFGEKTQAAVKKYIEFSMESKGKFHYASCEATALALVEYLKTQTGSAFISLSGDVRRKSIIIEKIEIVAAVSEKEIKLENFINERQIPIQIHTCDEESFAQVLFQTTGNSSHIKQLETFSYRGDLNPETEEDLYAGYELEYIEPELREGRGELNLAQNNNLPKLIEATDLKGILHNHSKYSDGMNTLAQMANRCRELGYSYFGICDHSQSAFYANGMKPETVLEQQLEIDELNNKMASFKIFKGIESDILNDGSLDYKKEILETFDFVVASIHSNLKMDQEKATARLLKAIENPFTTILGHPTGRLLLSREGYPIDHKKIIEACAANGVAIELNAHPYRLDIDWTWIPYCIDKGVLISINPDAHETEGLLDLHWGTAAARKGMLTKETCLNAMNLEEITKWFESKKTKTKQ
ncbi:MAG: DNA polymerase/3'-5' exonuclease PolX [Bacteroidetes bacterium]|nr:DNA polymerase/3'-5' exonuclease PolX [Bacteroidota bacterium]PHX83325.1 MAG: DNA polymerase/3'-5' exonuclease PolX [Flavobacteriales bacterium]